MRKSVTAMICGLIGSLFSLWWGFSFGLFGNMLNIIPSEEATNIGSTLTALGWISFLGAILGIVGASLSLKQARKGAICLSIAAVMCGILQIYLFVKTLTPDFVITAIMVFLLPTVLLIVASVFGWLAKDLAQPNQSVSQQNVQEPQAQQTKTLEQELSNLKSMLEKGLIDEQEFAETKKAILSKYTK